MQLIHLCTVQEAHLFLLVGSGGSRVPAGVRLHHALHGGNDFVVTRAAGLSLERVVGEISFSGGDGGLEEGHGLPCHVVVVAASEAAAGAPLVEGVAKVKI